MLNLLGEFRQTADPIERDRELLVAMSLQYVLGAWPASVIIMSSRMVNVGGHEYNVDHVSGATLRGFPGNMWPEIMHWPVTLLTEKALMRMALVDFSVVPTTGQSRRSGKQSCLGWSCTASLQRREREVQHDFQT